jgi:hypothetical protein
VERHIGSQNPLSWPALTTRPHRERLEANAMWELINDGHGFFASAFGFVAQNPEWALVNGRWWLHSLRRSSRP